LNAHKNWNNQSVEVSVNYTFTQSIDERTQKQLTYTPLHKLTTQFTYRYKNFSVAPSFLYIGKVYTTSSNDESSAIDAYGVFDVDFRQYFNLKSFPFTLNFKIKNVANTAYTNMPQRLMPGRNYHIQIIKKF
ncbi:MAG TPA: hypothetical protein VLY87_01450, partial [Flavobacterium sp.]|nr:hypothetical protein [Flavobacterium sp.]